MTLTHGTNWEDYPQKILEIQMKIAQAISENDEEGLRQLIDDQLELNRLLEEYKKRPA